MLNQDRQELLNGVFLTDEHGASIVTSVCPTWVVVVVVCHEDCSIVLLPPVINGLSGVHVLLTPLLATPYSSLLTTLPAFLPIGYYMLGTS